MIMIMSLHVYAYAANQPADITTNYLMVHILDCVRVIKI
jgi:hypothetical protein